MKAIAYAILKPESAEAFKSIELFHPRCVYPVISQSPDDVVIEIHPLCSCGQSSKLAVPRTMVARIEEKVSSLFTAGEHYEYSPNFIKCDGHTLESYHRWAGTYTRIADSRPMFVSGGDGSVEQAIIITAPMDPGASINVYAMSHWLLMPEANPTKPAKTKKNKLEPNKDKDMGRIVRLIDGPEKGSLWSLYGWDKFRGQFIVNNSVSDKRASPTSLELVEVGAEICKSGDLVTQSSLWLDRKQPRRGATGQELDKKPSVFIVVEPGPSCSITISAIDLRGIQLQAVSACLDDIRRLTKEELAAMEALRGGKGRDAKWLKSTMPDTLVRLIDVAPTSPFLPGMITAMLGVHAGNEFKTSDEVMVELLKVADKIKLKTKQATLTMAELAPFMPTTVANDTPAQPTAAHPQVEEVPLVPAATDYMAREVEEMAAAEAAHAAQLHPL